MSSASACAFGFLFSFIPVSMMIFVILFRFLHATPDVQNFIVSQFDFLSGFTSTISRLNESFDSISSITSFEVVLLWATIWMSRRCFSSTFTGLDRIFGEEQKSKGLTKQLLIFALEAITLIMISAGIFLVAASKSIVKLDFLAYFMKDASDPLAQKYSNVVDGIKSSLNGFGIAETNVYRFKDDSTLFGGAALACIYSGARPRCSSPFALL